MMQAHGHEGHDYVMYISDAGGCCDCGDVASWKPEGSCPAHRPLEADGATPDAPQLPLLDRVVLTTVLGNAFVQLVEAVQGEML